MQYKGYEGVVKFDDEAAIFYGEVINTRDVITFQGDSVDGLRKAFEDSIDDYLSFCEARGEEPEKPFSGKFLVRVRPELHRQIVTAAKRKGQSVNVFTTKALAEAIKQT